MVSYLQSLSANFVSAYFFCTLLLLMLSFFLCCWKLVPDSLVVNCFVWTYFGMKLHLGREELLLYFLSAFYHPHLSILR